MARREDREDQFSHARLSNEHVYGFERPGKAGRKKEGKETRIETDVLHLLIRINGFSFAARQPVERHSIRGERSLYATVQGVATAG